MNVIVFGAVVLAAAMHAGWNALVKVGQDRLLAITVIAAGGMVLTAPLLPFLDIPLTGAWPPLLLSVVLHVGYNLFLIRAYASGDLGQVYPIARGGAPLLVSVASALLLGEILKPLAMVGLLVLSGGIMMMAFGGGRTTLKLDRRAVAYALGTSVFIASYTVTDGIGSRLNGSPHGYAAWLFFLDGLAMLAIARMRRGAAMLSGLRPFWREGLAGGAMSLAAYWIVIWAMTRAPIPLVAALRETSVLFGALIAVVVLRERLTFWRSAAGLVIVTGIVLARAA